LESKGGSLSRTSRALDGSYQSMVEDEWTRVYGRKKGFKGCLFGGTGWLVSGQGYGARENKEFKINIVGAGSKMRHDWFSERGSSRSMSHTGN